MFRKLDHVGIVVKNLDEALKLYSDIFRLNPSDMNIVAIKDAGIRIVLLPIGDSFIELIEPSGTKSRFAQHLRERGEGLFHLSIFVEDFDNEVKTLKEKGYTLEEEAVADLFPGFTARFAWLSPEETTGVWIEIVDMASLPPAASD